MNEILLRAATMLEGEAELLQGKGDKDTEDLRADMCRVAEYLREIVRLKPLTVLNEVVDWVEGNVAYGLPDELLKKASDALRLGSKS